MTIDTETMQRIMVEVDLGVPAADSTVPASPEADEFRARISQEIAESKAAGRMLQFTPEFPDLTSVD